MLSARWPVPLALLLCLVGLTTTAAPPRPTARRATYDITDLIYRPGGKTGYDSAEEVATILLTSVSPKSCDVLDGTRLEVQATAPQHEDIAELLTALRRRLDVAVDLRADLIEVERSFFEKRIRPKLAARSGGDRLVVAVSDEKLLSRIQKAGKRLSTSKPRIADGRSALLWSRRSAFTYAARPDGKVAVGFSGVSVRGSVVVSSDRRFVRLKITQETARLRGLAKKTAWDVASGKEGVMEVPDLEESTAAGTVEVEDGSAALVPVAGAASARDRVQLLLLQPLIYIEEEEKERAGKR